MSAVTYRTMPGTTSPSGMPRGVFYRYGGSGVDELDQPRQGTRRTAARRRAPLSGAILGALAGLGGEASTTEIRRALQESGYPLTASRQVPDTLHRLARLMPPAVTAVGDPRGGFRKSQRWRLENAEAELCGGCQHLITTPIHRIVCGGESAA